MEHTITLSLRLFRLNTAKEHLLDQTAHEWLRVQKAVLALLQEEQRKLTTAKVQTTLKSAVTNSLIRQVRTTLKKAKTITRPRIEINNQNWTLHQAGAFWTPAFPTLQGVKRP
jgi:hypothetical protein